MNILAKIFGKRFLYGIFISVLFVFLLIAFFALLSRDPVGVQAQKAYFYPETCLGGFRSAKNASGVPEALDDLDYNAENSAIYQDGDSAIFCGEFKGELPPQTYQTRVTLRFSWQQALPVISPEQTSILDTIVDIFAGEENSQEVSEKDVAEDESNNNEDGEVVTSTEEIITEVSTSSQATSTDETVTSDEGGVVEPEVLDEAEGVPNGAEEVVEEEVTEVIEEVAEPEPESVPSPEPTSEPEPISWWQVFVNFAYAEELPATTTDEVVKSETEMASTTAVEEEPVVDGILPQEEVEEVNDGAAEAIFAVEYTLDGETWQNIGYVNTIDNDVRFELPKEVLVTIEDVNEVQIALRPLLRLDSQPDIYLDAMWFEISYAPVRELGVHAVSSLVPEKFGLADLFNTDGQINASTTLVGMNPDQFVASTTFIQGIDTRYAIAGVVMDEATELWLIDMDLKEVRRIGFAEAALGGYPLGAKERMIFWLNYDASIIFTYDLRTGGSLHEMALVGNLPEGEERRFTFPFTDWQVVWRAEELYFFKDSPGEVFRDENAKAVERFNTYIESVIAAKAREQQETATTTASITDSLEVVSEIINEVSTTTEIQNGNI